MQKNKESLPRRKMVIANAVAEAIVERLNGDLMKPNNPISNKKHLAKIAKYKRYCEKFISVIEQAHKNAGKSKLVFK